MPAAAAGSDKGAGTAGGSCRRERGSNYLILATTYADAGLHSVKNPGIWPIISQCFFCGGGWNYESETADLPVEAALFPWRLHFYL